MKIKEYFSNKLYEVHLFLVFGFSKKDYATFKIVSKAKAKNSGPWFFNNLYFPVLVILSPLALSVVHYYYGTVEYHKTVLEVLISGSLTLLGINVVRTASTAIAEKLDKSKVPSKFIDNIDELFDEIEAIRNKLERRVWVITFAGWGLYLLQIGQFVDASRDIIYVILFLVIILSFVSILYGRFIYLMKTNLFDKEEVIALLFGKLLNQSNDYNSLSETLKKQGL